MIMLKGGEIPLLMSLCIVYSLKSIHMGNADFVLLSTLGFPNRKKAILIKFYDVLVSSLIRKKFVLDACS